MRALLSVSDKTGLVEFATALSKLGVDLISTGGTAKILREAGLHVSDVSDITEFPEMMDGRVKTLHPKIHGGLLAVRDNPDHQKLLQDHLITPIDIVVVNLYPFEKTVLSGADFDTCIENIDIGGPAMVRSAAKNHPFVSILVDPRDYESVVSELQDTGTISLHRKRHLAAKAYAHTAAYDAKIASWFEAQNNQTPDLRVHASALMDLRYGENPHQRATVYRDTSNRAGVVNAVQLQGKELSYNNLNDTDAAFELVCEFSEPTIAIIKHANPCGVATGKNLQDAYLKALACDSVSAFGGIIAANKIMDADTASEIVKIFSEVIIAPDYTAEALAIFAKKDKIRVLKTHHCVNPAEDRLLIKSLSGGYLVQNSDADFVRREDLKIVTKLAPTESQIDDMLFAFRVAKHVKSNAIIYVSGLQTLGIGAGQMSRIDSTRIAAHKMKEAGLDKDQNGHPRDIVVASDAFFPFADGLLAAAEAGAKAIIQPGGSIKDQEVIDAANAKNLAMVFTGLRHFRH
jgi:phosphoribosylaminoimidazolecarboxamide formyltransferase / IMP cyclohydrolase